MTSGKSDIIDLSLEQFHETEKSYGVYNLDMEKVWLPKSQVDRDLDIFTMPEWLAKDKGLI